MHVGTHGCIQQDFPQQGLDVVVRPSHDDGQPVAAVHVVDVEAESRILAQSSSCPPPKKITVQPGFYLLDIKSPPVM